jgi:hypothetical protein
VSEPNIWTIEGPRIQTDQLVVLGPLLIATIRDAAGDRVAAGHYGPLLAHIGDITLSSDDSRQEIDKRVGYSADPSSGEHAGAPDNGVWMWQAPTDAEGHLTIEAEWLPALAGGTLELVIA